MGINMRVIMMMGMVICLASVSYADDGTATFYTPPYVPSACFGFQDQGVMIAAASAAIFNNKAACGRTYQVTCTGPTNQGVPQPCRSGSVTVKVVDLCPGCQGLSLDLSQEAFAKIADPNAGKIKISFNQV